MKRMKRVATILTCALLLVACSSRTGGGNAQAERVEIDRLRVMFVNTRENSEIMEATEGYEDLLKSGFQAYGYDIEAVEIVVSEDQNACGEALAKGEADIAYVGANTYATYADQIQAVLTATVNVLSVDSDTAADWNGDANATKETNDAATHVKGLIFAAPTEKGRAIAEKANGGEAISWDNLADCAWSIGSPTSAAAYLYPNAWLNAQYEKRVRDLPLVSTLSYEDAFRQAASEQIDVVVCYADGRAAYQSQWENEWGRQDSIWNEMNVIAVTGNIPNDAICVTKQNETIASAQFQEALVNVFQNFAKSDAGKQALALYGHTGYAPFEEDDYAYLREALKVASE